jgi:uncharacterized protein YjbI with pentapeptide repeats
MTPKQVKDIFDKLPSKRRKVLVGFLAGHSREKIMIDAGVPSDDALTGHLKELYKNFRIDTGWNDADDRRSGARKLPLLISLFARCMPELISDRNPDVLDGVEQEEAIANEPTVTNPLESDTAPKISIEVSSFLEYFSKSIDQLKSKDLDVRIGAISTLETIAKYSQPAEHWTIMEYLAAFVRSNAPRKEEGEEKRSPELREDIQAALTVIGRRDTEKDAPNKKLDLSNTDIRKVELPRAKFQKIILSGAKLQGANLFEAILEEADLSGAKLQGAQLCKANLKRAKLHQANLQEANFSQANLTESIIKAAILRHTTLYQANLQRADLRLANLQEAFLDEADLQEANFSQEADITIGAIGAKLQGAHLNKANLQETNFIGADLSKAKLQKANFSEAKLKSARLHSADLQGAINLKQQQIEQALGNSKTILPSDIKRPEHWMNPGK